MTLFRREAARFRNPLISEETARIRNPLIRSYAVPDEPQEVAFARRDPNYNWRQAKVVTPGFFMELLRSDELPPAEMAVFRTAAADWKKRDKAIFHARHDGGLFVVHPYSNPNSEWVKRNKAAAPGPSVPMG